MPRLLGIVASQPVDLSFSLAGAPEHFASRKQNNPDGWGLGWFSGGQPSVRKSALPAGGAVPAEQASAQAHARLFVAHVRRSSRAPRADRNTHPFSAGGWLFAHTGALYPLLEVAVRRQSGRAAAAEAEGQTDSEALFRLLLHHLGRPVNPIQAIRDTVAPIVADGQFSALNFLLARDGELYAFRHAVRSASYYSLYWNCRGPGRPLACRSSETRAEVSSQGLALTRSIIVCSEQVEQPAAGESWRALGLGELLVVQASPEPSAETLRLLD